MRTKATFLVTLFLALMILGGCPPKKTTPTKTGSHELLTFSSAGTDVTFTPTTGSPPASRTLTATVQTYDDYSDGTSKLASPPGVNGAVITITTDDPANRCVSVSATSITTGAGGSATLTASAAAARVTTCTTEITATYANAKNGPQIVNIRNKAP